VTFASVRIRISFSLLLLSMASDSSLATLG
jgi:hypothetical protein